MNTNETCNNKFILVKKASGEHYSVEAGLHDGVKNFDHHPGSWEALFQSQPPSPCNNESIDLNLKGQVIEITHMDADTLLGISRMLEYYHPGYRHNQFWGIYRSLFGDHKMDCEFHLTASKIERIDLNGSKGVGKFDQNLLYMVGVGQVCRDIKFPRLAPDQESLDVSEYVEKLFADYGCEEFIEIGRKTQEKAEKAYTECKVAEGYLNFSKSKIVINDAKTRNEFIKQIKEAETPTDEYMGGIELEGVRAYQECKVAEGDLNLSANSSTQEETLKGLWVVGPDDAFDPSQPYEDGVQIVVVYRSHYKSISIYCDPSSVYEFGGKEVGNILFAGHAKACGSPRGEEMTLEDAKRVFESI